MTNPAAIVFPQQNQQSRDITPPGPNGPGAQDYAPEKRTSDRWIPLGVAAAIALERLSK
jgi:hypothetical protein